LNAEGRFVPGDVLSVDFGADPEDPEQAFRRPALIVSDDRLDHPNLRMVIVVPGTLTFVRCRYISRLSPMMALVLIRRRRSKSSRSGRLGRLDPVSHAIDEILRNALNL